MTEVANKKTVLFLCTHNSCRSQMAEGLLRRFHGDAYDSYSAGTEATRVHPLAMKVMDEIGIDISQQKSKTIDTFQDFHFDYVVTVCDNAKEACPFFPGKHVVHKCFRDPSSIKGSDNQRIQAFRDTRDMIKQWIDETFAKKQNE